MNEALPPIEKLAWDSAHFGFGVGRVRTSRLTVPEAQFCAQQAREERIRCVYFLAASGDPDSWRAAEAAGFEAIDVRVELALEPSRSPGAGSRKSRKASEEDLPRLRELTRDSFFESRFFRDPRFPREKSAALFDTWVERGVRDAGSFTLVENGEEVPRGFASARTMPDGTGRIELVTVSRESWGTGLGSRLVESVVLELASRGAPQVAVVTQASNTAALRLYEQAGFRVRTVDLWFHGWF